MDENVIGRAIVNYYDEFGIDRDASSQEIREILTNQKYGMQSRSSKAGKVGMDAQKRLGWIVDAERILLDEDAREKYDLSLLRKPTETETETEAEIDWLNRAWSYYFNKDYGAASVAARKTREKYPTEASSFVISGWNELAEDEFKNAKKYSDEAFVLDELGEDSVDVHELRGVIFNKDEKYDKAHNSFERALKKASNYEKPNILWRNSLVYFNEANYDEQIRCATEGLEICAITDIPPDIIKLLENSFFTGLVSKVLVSNNTSDSVLIAFRKSMQDVGNSSFLVSSKRRIIAGIAGNISIAERLIERDQLKQIKEPEALGCIGGVLYILPLVIGVIFTLSGIAVAVMSHSPVLLIIGLILLAVFVIATLRKSQYKTAYNLYINAQIRIKDIEKEDNNFISDLDKIVTVAPNPNPPNVVSSAPIASSTNTVNVNTNATSMSSNNVDNRPIDVTKGGLLLFFCQGARMQNLSLENPDSDLKSICSLNSVIEFTKEIIPNDVQFGFIAGELEKLLLGIADYITAGNARLILSNIDKIVMKQKCDLNAVIQVISAYLGNNSGDFRAYVIAAWVLRLMNQGENIHLAVSMIDKCFDILSPSFQTGLIVETIQSGNTKGYGFTAIITILWLLDYQNFKKETTSQTVLSHA